MAKINTNELSKELIAKAPEELIALAKEEGVEITQEEAEAYFAELEDFELDSIDLQQVAAGTQGKGDNCDLEKKTCDSW